MPTIFTDFVDKGFDLEKESKNKIIMDVVESELMDVVESELLKEEKSCNVFIEKKTKCEKDIIKDVFKVFNYLCTEKTDDYYILPYNDTYKDNNNENKLSYNFKFGIYFKDKLEHYFNTDEIEDSDDHDINKDTHFNRIIFSRDYDKSFKLYTNTYSSVNTNKLRKGLTVNINEKVYLKGMKIFKNLKPIKIFNSNYINEFISDNDLTSKNDIITKSDLEEKEIIKYNDY